MYKKIFLLVFLFTNLLLVSSASALDLTITLNQDTQKVEAGKRFRISIYFNKPVSKLSLSDFSVSGAEPQEVRKGNSKRYYLFLRASENTTNADIQIEAEKITSVDGTINSESSNNLIIPIGSIKKDEAIFKKDSTNISDLLDLVVSKARQSAQTTYTSQSQPSTKIEYYNCNGQAIPITQACSGVVFNNSLPTYYYNPNGYMPAPMGYNPYYAPFGNSYNNFSQPPIYYINGQPVVLYNNSFIPLSRTYYYSNPYFDSSYYYTRYRDYDYYDDSNYFKPIKSYNSSGLKYYGSGNDGYGYGTSKSSKASKKSSYDESEYDRRSDAQQDKEIYKEAEYDRKSDEKQDAEIYKDWNADRKNQYNGSDSSYKVEDSKQEESRGWFDWAI